LANRAVHGETVDADTARELAILGGGLVRALQELFLEKLVEPVASVPVSSETVKEFQEAIYQVTTIVPTMPDARKTVYVLNQQALDAWLEGYETHGEFLIAIKRMPSTHDSILS
jgi:hypothetical protein